MREILKFKFVLIACSLFFSITAGKAFAEQSCATAECHVRFQKGIVYHPTELECGACHLETPDSHAEGGAKPVMKEQMCTPCHDDALDFQFNHAPVTATTCQLCHDPHGDMKQYLLADCSFSKLFVNYKEDSYKLCFSCHKRDLLMFPDTMYSTDFRDGAVNLHYLHVNKQNRGRSCKLCHGVHGANQPKMMADSVSFGDWLMPVNFKKTETGGSCAPGCHQPRQYDRKIRKDVPVVEKKNQVENK